MTQFEDVAQSPHYRNMPQWALAALLVAGGYSNRNWSGWGEKGEMALRLAAEYGAIDFVGENQRGLVVRSRDIIRQAATS